MNPAEPLLPSDPAGIRFFRRFPPLLRMTTTRLPQFPHLRSLLSIPNNT